MSELKKALQEIQTLEVGSFVTEYNHLAFGETYNIRTKDNKTVIATNLLFEVLGKYPNIYSFAGSDEKGTYIAIW